MSNGRQAIDEANYKWENPFLSIDDLAAAIKATSSEAEVQRLGDLLLEWKNDDMTVDDLRFQVEQYIDDTWGTSDAVRSGIYRLWAEFRDNAILGIAGMTMNERLAWFGLFTRSDHARTAAARRALYAKVLARP